jgi:UDP-3-O-[3-hydroxymyristoyl] glucosamine N-acyltransferase
MKFNTPQNLQVIATLIDASILGNADNQAIGINEIHKVTEGDICFVDHPKYYNKCLQSKATIIIINNKDVEIPSGKTLLYCSDPFEAYLKIVDTYKPFIASTEAISTKATFGKNTIVMPNVFIGDDVVLGDDCVIHPNVTIHNGTIIGNNVVIQSGSVIGSDAFYYNTKKNREVWFKRMKSCGNVLIEDNVEIGSGCTIDRGVTDSTIIGKGTIMDNQVHIGHDVTVGKNCLFAAQVGIAGATVIEDGVTLWGQVGVNKTITIGSGAVVMGQSGVVGNIDGNKMYWGTPAINFGDKKRESVWIKRIPELWNKIRG